MTTYFDQVKSTWRRTLGAILGFAVAIAVVVSSFLGWKEFRRQIEYQLIVSTFVSLFWLSGPFIRSYGDRVNRCTISCSRRGIQYRSLDRNYWN